MQILKLLNGYVLQEEACSWPVDFRWEDEKGEEEETQLWWLESEISHIVFGFECLVPRLWRYFEGRGVFIMPENVSH